MRLSAQDSLQACVRISKFLAQPFQYLQLVCRGSPAYLDEESFCRSGRVSVTLDAPSLQTEQMARKLEGSSLPPRLLSMIWPMCSRVFRLASYGWGSPATAPHIWQVKPLRSRAIGPCFLDISRAKAGWGLDFRAGIGRA